MKITIAGGGNIGTQFAVHCAEKGNDVIIYSSKYEIFENELEIVNENNEIIHRGKILKATNDTKEAFENADIIFVTVPAFLINDISKKIYPYVTKNMKIGIIPGTGGGECAFKKCIEKGSIVFGMQRVPSVARVVKIEKKVCATGYREKLYVASLPQKYTEECCNIINEIFDMPCDYLPNYLNLTLTPSNPILHTTRLNIIFKNYKEGTYYKELPLFYENWNNETSELLFKCDDEVQLLCSKLSNFDLTYVKSLKEHYESNTPEALTNKIQSIKGFKGLTTPSIKEDGKFLPNLNSRYFTADFNYGLIILIQIANLINLPVPYMQGVWNWYEQISLFDKKFSFKDYNINTYEELEEFYSI